MSCGIGRRCSLDLTLLWLWRRLAATAPIRPLAWEPPYATGATLKRQKKKKSLHCGDHALGTVQWVGGGVTATWREGTRGRGKRCPRLSPSIPRISCLAQPMGGAEDSQRKRGLIRAQQPLWRRVWRYLRKLYTEPECDPAIPLLGIYLHKTFPEKDTCTLMFTAALCTTAQTWKQPKCPPADDWIKKMWYI